MPHLERLTREHATARFRSGSPDPDVWFRDAAVTADRAGIARVYVWVDDAGEVVGYFAITPHTVRRAEVPSSVGRGPPRA